MFQNGSTGLSEAKQCLEKIRVLIVESKQQGSYPALLLSSPMTGKLLKAIDGIDKKGDLEDVLAPIMNILQLDTASNEVGRPSTVPAPSSPAMV